MAHHGKTPKSVLDAPVLTPKAVHVTTEIRTLVFPGGKLPPRLVHVAPAFVGDVEHDLLGVQVGFSRKGREVRRASTLRGAR